MIISKIKTILEWETTPRVELDFMNDTHFEEIEMVKEIGELINTFLTDNNQQNRNALSLKLNAWLDHTMTHFDHENTLMQETNFPAYPIHKNEHENALNEMRDVINAWIKNQDIDLVENYIFSLWPAWFNQHVSTMDMMTAKIAVMNGYTNH